MKYKTKVLWVAGISAAVGAFGGGVLARQIMKLSADTIETILTVALMSIIMVFLIFVGMGVSPYNIIGKIYRLRELEQQEKETQKAE